MRLVLCALVLIVAGCTTTTRTPPGNMTGEAITAWEIKGRLAARVDHRGETASFIWQRQQDNHSIELYGPLGSGRVFLRQQQGVASLIDRSTELFGDSLEDVLFQRSGWLIPFDELQQWIIGQPQFDEITEQKYVDGRLTGFRQSGWRVSYDNYRHFADASIPTRITLTASDSYIYQLSGHSGRSIESARVKIIIKTFTGS